VEGLSCVEEIQLGRHLINPVEVLSLMEREETFGVASGVEETNFPTIL